MIGSNFINEGKKAGSRQSICSVAYETSMLSEHECDRKREAFAILEQIRTGNGTAVIELDP